MFKQSFALRCKAYASVGTNKEFAAKLCFKIVHASGNVWLIIVKCFGGFCETFISSYKIKNTVIIIVYHFINPLYKIYMTAIQNILFTSFCQISIIHLFRKNKECQKTGK